MPKKAKTKKAKKQVVFVRTKSGLKAKVGDKTDKDVGSKTQASGLLKKHRDSFKEGKRRLPRADDPLQLDLRKERRDRKVRV